MNDMSQPESRITMTSLAECARGWLSPDRFGSKESQCSHASYFSDLSTSTLQTVASSTATTCAEASDFDVDSTSSASRPPQPRMRKSVSWGLITLVEAQDPVEDHDPATAPTSPTSPENEDGDPLTRAYAKCRPHPELFEVRDNFARQTSTDSCASDVEGTGARVPDEVVQQRGKSADPAVHRAAGAPGAGGAHRA